MSGICFYKGMASSYKQEKLQANLKLMHNLREREDIKDRLTYKANKAADVDESFQLQAAQEGKTLTKSIGTEAWHNSSEYKQLIADDAELELDNSNLEAEIAYLDDVIKAFDDRQKDETKNCQKDLWGIGGG